MTQAQSASPSSAAVVDDWSMVVAQLPSNWREVAEAHHLVKACNARRPQLGAKVTDVEIPLRLLLYRAATDNSLRTTAAAGYAGQVIDISAPALHYWERRMGPFLADLVGSMADTERAFAPERWAGFDIVLQDATSVCRPGSEGTTAKVHYALRLPTLRPVGIKVTDDRGGETFRLFDAEQGELWVGDRAYANPPGIAHRKARGAEVLVRYNRGSLPLYDVAGQRIDVLGKLARLRKPKRVREWAAWVYPEGMEPIAGRLVAVRLPADKAEEARERLRKEQGKEVTSESLAMADFVVVFATVPKNKLSCERLLELYGLRWQVELHIKRDKSIAGLDKLPNYRSDTIYTWICAKLLLTQIARKLTSAAVAIPPSGLGDAFLGKRAISGAERPTAGATTRGQSLGAASSRRTVAHLHRRLVHAVRGTAACRPAIHPRGAQPLPRTPGPCRHHVA